MLQCGGLCGQLVSRGFPHAYGERERTRWTVRVKAGHYATLAFLDFDVYERPLADCLRDSVEVFDVDLVDALSSLGKCVLLVAVVFALVFCHRHVDFRLGTKQS